MRFSAAVSVFLLSASFCAARDVRVGVFGLFRPARIEVRALTEPLLFQEGGRTFSIGPGGVIAINAVELHGELLARGDFELCVPGKLSRRFAGLLQITARAGVLKMSISMDLETAVASSLAAEMPSGTPPEALKAMAVVVRSYYTASKQRHDGFDFCDTTHCQSLRSPPPPRDPVWQAIEATRGVTLAYNGSPVAAMYSAECGGRTQAPGDAGLNSHSYPYQAVECASCLRNAVRWTRLLERSSAEGLLAQPSERFRIRLARKLGWDVLPSNNYSAHLEGDRIRITGRGRGHGAGLCQSGAAYLAEKGADYRGILTYFLPGIQLTLQPSQAKNGSSPLKKF